jgi:hypothetical protein
MYRVLQKMSSNVELDFAFRIAWYATLATIARTKAMRKTARTLLVAILKMILIICVRGTTTTMPILIGNAALGNNSYQALLIILRLVIDFKIKKNHAKLLIYLNRRSYHPDIKRKFLL